MGGTVLLWARQQASVRRVCMCAIATAVVVKGGVGCSRFFTVIVAYAHHAPPARRKKNISEYLCRPVAAASIGSRPCALSLTCSRRFAPARGFTHVVGVARARLAVTTISVVSSSCFFERALLSRRPCICVRRCMRKHRLVFRNEDDVVAGSRWPGEPIFTVLSPAAVCRVYQHRQTPNGHRPIAREGRPCPQGS